MILFATGLFNVTVAEKGNYEILPGYDEWNSLCANFWKEASLQDFFRGFNPFDTKIG